MRLSWKAILCTSLWFAAAFPLQAQSGPEPAEILIQEWTFDTGIGDWTTQNSTTSVTWAADGTPGMIGAELPYTSSPNSLNYNNGLTYNSPSTGNNGSATSPLLDIGGLSTPKIIFSCLYGTEPSPLWDTRTIEVSNNGFTGPSLLTEQLLDLGTSPLLGDCKGAGVWHTHTLELNPTWGAVEIRFSFDSIDDMFNEYPGWFIDDVKLTATGGTAGFFGYNPESKPEGENGDNSINDTLCGGSIPQKPMETFLLGMAITILLYLGYQLKNNRKTG